MAIIPLNRLFRCAGLTRHNPNGFAIATDRLEIALMIGLVLTLWVGPTQAGDHDADFWKAVVTKNALGVERAIAKGSRMHAVQLPEYLKKHFDPAITETILSSSGYATGESCSLTSAAQYVGVPEVNFASRLTESMCRNEATWRRLNSEFHSVRRAAQSNIIKSCITKYTRKSLMTLLNEESGPNLLETLTINERQAFYMAVNREIMRTPEKIGRDPKGVVHRSAQQTCSTYNMPRRIQTDRVVELRRLRVVFGF